MRPSTQHPHPELVPGDSIWKTPFCPPGALLGHMTGQGPTPGSTSFPGSLRQPRGSGPGGQGSGGMGSLEPDAQLTTEWPIRGAGGGALGLEVCVTGKEGVEGCPQPGGDAGKDSEFVRVKTWPEAAVRKTSRWSGWEGLGVRGARSQAWAPAPLRPSSHGLRRRPAARSAVEA